MIIYRPVGLQELKLIYDSGMKAFPVHLPQQPIFYPVLQLEYARQIASDWNAQNGQLAGYVTQCNVDDRYVSHFEKHTVGKSSHQELWIPTEELEEFNKHIIGHIKVVEASFREEFQGFIPEKFGLQGKNAAEQFSWLANSYIYKRMDFYLELKRNHKTVFINYLFWQKYDFKNPGLKEKILKAIKEAWFTSFPKIPLPNPLHEVVEPAASPHTVASVDLVDKEIPPVAEPKANSSQSPIQEVTPLKEETIPHSFEDSAPEHAMPVKKTDSHFTQGVKLALSEKYREAIEELSKAVEEEPNHVIAQTSLGVVFHRLGEDEPAFSCYEAALQLDPKSAEAHYFRANILYQQGNIREALTEYTIAIGLQPDLIEAHQKPTIEDRLTDYSGWPAEMYWIAKSAHRILELNKSLELNAQQANLFKERAAEYSRLGNYEQAIADYSASLELQPEDANALHFRGQSYERLGQFELALKDDQRALALNPQLADVFINRGISFGKTGNFRQSLASLTEGIRLAPQNPDGYFNRGMTYFQQREFEHAIDDFSNVIQLAPTDEDAYYWRGVSREEAGHQHEAVSDYEQFLVFTQNSQAKAEIEQKLSRWRSETQSSQSVMRHDREIIDSMGLKSPDEKLDLYDLLFTLGERVIHSTWFGSNVNCYGEKAEELHAFADYNRPINGQDFLRMASGIQQTIEGDFTAFDPDTTAPWIFIRAWDGTGFYVEINDHQSRKQLMTRFQKAEEMENVTPPYMGLFIPI
jgi:tetratricopeptide (TPR) repeat protein